MDQTANRQKEVNDIIASTTVMGNLPSMKNRRRLIPGKGSRRTMIIKSVDSMAYEQAFLLSIPNRLKVGYEGPVSVKTRIYYQDRRSDLSVEFLYDLLQKAGIIKTDNQIMHSEEWKGLDRENPRVIFTVYKYKQGEG